MLILLICSFNFLLWAGLLTPIAVKSYNRNIYLHTLGNPTDKASFFETGGAWGIFMKKKNIKKAFRYALDEFDYLISGPYRFRFSLGTPIFL